MDIKDKNIKIAEFMGGFQRSSGFSMVWDHKDHVSPLICKSTEGLKYHASFDWLMPVVEEIEKRGCIIQISISLGRLCKIIKVNSYNKPVEVYAHESMSTIESVHEACYQFIESLNK